MGFLCPKLNDNTHTNEEDILFVNYFFNVNGT